MNRISLLSIALTAFIVCARIDALSDEVARSANDLWSLRPVSRPLAPPVKNAAWVKNRIDQFVLARLEKEHLNPSPYADRRTLIRRLSLDLIGLPPMPEEVEAFVSDKSSDAYAIVVDHLLASKHFGERMALHWLDLARYADSDGYHDDTDRSMWAWRDYVIDSFNRNKRFDQFTIEQLAGDLLPNPAREQLIASAFNRLGPTSSEGGAIVEEYMAKYAVDRVNTTSSVWQGLTVQCAECHDHKYDPITTKDYYQLFAFFNQVPENVLYRGADAPPTIPAPTAEQAAKMVELNKQIATLELEAKAEAEDKSAAPAEAARAAAVNKKLNEVKGALAEIEKNSKLRIMADLSPRNPTHVLVRGDYRRHGDEVKPTAPAAIGPRMGPMTNRLELARWLVDARNPLTARVTVNRFWQMLFGTGLVKTSDDFGTRGERPTHAALLDWLASEFVDSDWDIKHVLRLMVTSATYQQSSAVCSSAIHRASAQPAESTRAINRATTNTDPENRLLARGARVRLQAELIRDNALAIAGLLDRMRVTGGPSVKPYQPGDLWRELSSGDQVAKSYVQDHGADLYRRGLYTFWKRSIHYPAFAVFDAPKRETCVIRRPITNTPLQAFVTMNDVTYIECARVFAQRILQKGGASTESRMSYAFRRALARGPSARETRAMTRLYNETLARYRTDEQAARKLVSIGEFARPKELDLAEHAAWTCVCNAILNLDETITKE